MTVIVCTIPVVVYSDAYGVGVHVRDVLELTYEEDGELGGGSDLVEGLSVVGVEVVGAGDGIWSQISIR